MSRIAAGVVLLGLAIVACPPSPTVSQPQRLGSRSAGAASTSAGPPAASAVASTLASSVGSTASSAKPPAPQPAPPTTPKGIWCETTTCDLALEFCCAVMSGSASFGRCVPRSEEHMGKSCCPNKQHWFCGNDGGTVFRECDEAGDCPANKHCCRGGGGESDWSTTSCESQCLEEVCLPGSTCKNGNPCGAYDLCPLEIAPPSCGDATCKRGEACCWISKGKTKGRGVCAKTCDDVKAPDGGYVKRFACTSPDHCGPHDCNSAGGNQGFFCGGDGFMDGYLCKSLADCPKHLNSLGTGPGAPTKKGCTHDPSLPPGVKSCDYM